MEANILEKEKMLSSIIKELNETIDLKDSIKLLCKRLNEITSCSCIGIRMEENGDYPYFAYSGFPETFIQSENSLCIKDNEGNIIREKDSEDYLLECMCGNIIRKRFNPCLPFFTHKGSFWSNNTSALLANTSEAERQSNTRNYCNSCGYESVALIPVKSNGNNIGLIQLNDMRQDMFSAELINFVEFIGEITGIIIENRFTLLKLQKCEIEKRHSDELNMQKSMFLSNMSHEIRTPLNGILGMAQLLQQTSMTIDQMSMFDSIIVSSKHLMNIINDILDLAKLESGHFDICEESFSLINLLNEIINLLKVISDKKGIELRNSYDIAIPSMLTGDPLRIRQILINLIGNAIKFTENGYVEISVKLAKNYYDRIQLNFDVTDTGIGISEMDVDKLFHSFTQLNDSASKRYQGTGLGLSISKHLIELMGGSILVTSRIGQGSKFSFSLVLKKCEPTDQLNNRAFINDNFYGIMEHVKMANILLIEDDYINRSMLEAFFFKNKVKLLTAQNAEEGFDILNKEKIDLLLLDIQLPDISGYEVVRRIRTGENNEKQLPIIATTAYALHGDKERCIECGMDAYLPKPINFNMLTDLLNRFVRG